MCASTICLVNKHSPAQFCLTEPYMYMYMVEACWPQGKSAHLWINQVVWVRALTRDIVMCSWARHSQDSHSASLHPGI